MAIESLTVNNCTTEVEGESLVRKVPSVVKRPALFDFNRPIKAPGWEVTNMVSSANPRDVMVTVGNVVLEATMSNRGRYFEYLPYREIVRDLWRRDARVLWKAAPNPAMDDSLFRPAAHFLSLTPEQKVRMYLLCTSICLIRLTYSSPYRAHRWSTRSRRFATA